MKRITISIIFFLIACQIVCADIVEETISGEKIWWQSRSPYIVKRNITIDRDVTLKIEPGVIVKFDKDCQIIVKGTLIASGNTDHPIVFTSNVFMPTKGDWFGMYFLGPTSNQSVIAKCIIEYAQAAILITGSSLRIYDSIIRNNSEYGIRCKKGRPSIVDNNISNNGYEQPQGSPSTQLASGISLSGLGTSPIIRFNTISNNTAGIYISSEATPVIVYNTIVNNRHYGIYYENNDRMVSVQKCNLYGNGKYEIYVHGAADLSASDNFWGMEITAEMNVVTIAQNIYPIFDSRDSSQLGTVQYGSWREAQIDIAQIADRQKDGYKIEAKSFNKPTEVSINRHRRGYVLYTYSDNKRVVIDYGKSDEIEEGMEFEVVRLKEKHVPSPGEVIGTITIGKISDRFSKAEIVHADRKIEIGDLVRLTPMSVVSDKSWITSHTHSEYWKRYKLDVSSKRYWSNCQIVLEKYMVPTAQVKNFFQDTQADYIWHTALQKRGYVYFRKTFEIEGRPSQGILNIAVKNRSDVYVNGYKVGLCNDPNKVFEFNVTSLLKNDKNIIAVLANRDTIPGTPVGLVVSLMIERTP